MEDEKLKIVHYLTELPNATVLRWLTRLIYENTIAARDGYSSDINEIRKPCLIRELNEINHRISSVVMQALDDEEYSVPIDFVVGMHINSNFPNKTISIAVRNSLVLSLQEVT